jgi:hypothetical protein
MRHSVSSETIVLMSLVLILTLAASRLIAAFYGNVVGICSYLVGGAAVVLWVLRSR